MIIKANLSKDEFTHVKDIKMGELAVITAGSLLDHIVLRCEIGLISLTNPNDCIHKSSLEMRTMDMSCRILREEEVITLYNKNPLTRQIPLPTKVRGKARTFLPENKKVDVAWDAIVNKMTDADIAKKYDLGLSTVQKFIRKYRDKVKELQEEDV